MAELLGVELARPGIWKLSSGTSEFTAEMLRDAADFHASTGGQRIPLGFGHLDQRFDGNPAWGWLTNVRYAEDGDGPVLLGDLTDLEDWVHAAAPARWPHRSIEGVKGVTFAGREYGLVLTALRLLGETPPGIPVLKSLSDLRRLVAASVAAAGGEWITAEFTGEVVMAHGSHNQKSHGNRIGKPGNIPGKTGLAADANMKRVGTHDVRDGDEVVVVSQHGGGSRNPHIGRKGRVIDRNINQITVEFSDSKSPSTAEIFRKELKVTRTAGDLEAEDNAEQASRDRGHEQRMRELGRRPAKVAASLETSPQGAAEHPSDREGAVGMPDAAKLREALDLKADASDDEIRAALASAGLGVSPTEPPKPAPDPVPQPEPAPAPEPQLVAAAAPVGVPGTIVLASSVWEETQKTIAKLSAFVDETKRGERDQIIASAVESGRFYPSQKAQFVRLWDADPEGTRALIEGLTPNSALAVAASGYVDSDDKEFAREFAGLFPPSDNGGRRG